MVIQNEWGSEPRSWVDVASAIGPWVYGALVLLLVARAIARRRRYEALSVLGPADQEAVRAAVADAEKKTHGDIAPVVLERSDPHPSAEWLAALVSLVVGTALLAGVLPWDSPFALLACQLGLGALGFVLARAMPDVKRLFVSDARATALAEEQAVQEFHRAGVHRTRDAAGVLLFVSLLERSVVVLGDSGIHAKVGDAHWEATREAVLAGIARGSLRDGLLDGVRACGRELERWFPAEPGQRNEVPDRLTVRRE